MKSEWLKHLLFYWLWTEVFSISIINAEVGEDMWLDPDAWARDHLAASDFQPTNNKCCRCTNIQVENVNTELPLQELKDATAEDVASSIYFKKFVTMLFNRKHFKYDSSNQHYKRSISFTINSYQMDKLEQLLDPRDLDNILIEVFNNMDTTLNFDGQDVVCARETSTAIKTIVYNVLYDMRQLTKSSEMRFLLVVLLVTLIVWFINKRLKISWLLLVSGGVVIYGYFHTYLECNRELEVNQMLEILNSDTANNKKTPKFLNFFRGLFTNDDDKIRLQQNIRQSAKLSLGFCRPDHVFIMYFNDIFLKYLQMLIEQCTVTITSLNGSLRFPYNLLAPFFVVFLVGYLLKITFQYILNPSAWVQLLHHKNEGVSKTASNSEDDRISGDNLKLLLNAINAVPQRNAVEKSSEVSGVEDVTESIESSSKRSSPKVGKTTSEKVKNKIVLNKRQSEESIEGEIEGTPEYS